MKKKWMVFLSKIDPHGTQTFKIHPKAFADIEQAEKLANDWCTMEGVKNLGMGVKVTTFVREWKG